MRLTAGDHWANLTVESVYTKPVKIKDGAVTETRIEQFVVFTCACGRKFELPGKQITGRRALRDCGCRTSVPAGGMACGVYLDLETAIEMKRLAYAQHVTVSSLIAGLCREYTAKAGSKGASVTAAPVAKRGKKSGK